MALRQTLAPLVAASAIALSAGGAQARQEPSSTDVLDALMTLNEQRLSSYLQRGWNASWSMDGQGNTALHQLMMVCERDPTHDRAALVRVARMLVNAGANPRLANKWNDTPLTIAQSPRYCGPYHPVAAYLRDGV